MIIEYFFDFDDKKQLHFQVDLDRQFDFKQDLTAAPEWTKLDNNQCANCPLKKNVFSHCPAALDLDKVMGQIEKELLVKAIHESQVTAVKPELFLMAAIITEPPQSAMEEDENVNILNT